MSAFSRFTSLVAVFFLTLTHLDAKSVIIDDAETDKIIYSSVGWKISGDCSNCVTGLDTRLVKTWHVGDKLNDSAVFFTFTFTGTSVEVIYITWLPVDVIYSIDNLQDTATGRSYEDHPYNVYNQTLFRQEGLANVQHTLRVEISSEQRLVFDYIIYDDGTVVTGSNTTSLASSTVLSASSTSHTMGPIDDQTITGVSSGSRPNIGAIVGGVVAGLVVSVAGVALIWYHRRMSQKTSQGGISPFLGLRSGANGNAPPSGARTEELPRFHYYPTNKASVPPSGQTGTCARAREPSPSRAFHARTNSIHAPFTTPSDPFATTNPGDIHSDPGVHQSSGAYALGMSSFSAQGPAAAAGGPPNSSYNVAAGCVQGQIPNEPVEQGLMHAHAEAGTHTECHSTP